jgi:hypothetical protein
MKNPNRPQLWFQPGDIYMSHLIGYCARLRIFYPDGRVCWQNLYNLPNSFYTFGLDDVPCYLKHRNPTSLKESFRLAKAYDKRMCFPEMEFVSYL